LLDRGFAVLAYDKRGQGESGGRYALAGGGHDNMPHMKRRSTDVMAAVQELKKRSDVDGAQIGLMGGSQAGWVIPMVAEAGDIAFTITLSGGATPLSLEGRFSNWASESGSGGTSIDEVLKRLRKQKPRDYDFRPHFEAQKAPGLWLYGGLDRSNPSVLCIEMLEDIRRRNGNDFTIAWFPKGNHGLWQARVGGAAEYSTLAGLVPDLHRTVSDWLEEKGFGVRQTSAAAMEP
jgi:pimeloyl-ACP methyl ester carboxylesterase